MGVSARGCRPQTLGRVGLSFSIPGDALSPQCDGQRPLPDCPPPAALLGDLAQRADAPVWEGTRERDFRREKQQRNLSPGEAMSVGQSGGTGGRGRKSGLSLPGLTARCRKTRISSGGSEEKVSLSPPASGQVPSSIFKAVSDWAVPTPTFLFYGQILLGLLPMKTGDCPGPAQIIQDNLKTLKALTKSLLP